VVWAWLGGKAQWRPGKKGSGWFWGNEGGNSAHSEGRLDTRAAATRRFCARKGGKKQTVAYLGKGKEERGVCTAYYHERKKRRSASRERKRGPFRDSTWSEKNACGGKAECPIVEKTRLVHGRAKHRKPGQEEKEVLLSMIKGRQNY